MFCCDTSAQLVGPGGGRGITGGGNGLGQDTGNITLGDFYFDLDWQIQRGQFGRPFRDSPDGSYEIHGIAFSWAQSDLAAIGDQAMLRAELFDRDGDLVDHFDGQFERLNATSYRTQQMFFRDYPRKPGGAVAALPLTLRLRSKTAQSVAIGQTTLGGGERGTSFTVRATNPNLRPLSITVSWNNAFHIVDDTPIETVIAALVGPNNVADPSNNDNRTVNGIAPAPVWDSSQFGIANADSCFGKYSSNAINIAGADDYSYDVGNRAGEDFRFNFGTWVTVNHPSYILPNGKPEIAEVSVQGGIRTQ